MGKQTKDLRRHHEHVRQEDKAVHDPRPGVFHSSLSDEEKQEEVLNLPGEASLAGLHKHAHVGLLRLDGHMSHQKHIG